MFYLEDNKNFIKITFQKIFCNHFKELYFMIDMNKIYYDNSHLNYIYEKVIDNIKYTFHGFYQDHFFTIIMNSYNLDLKINIEHKFLVLIKLDWIIKKINEDKSIWCIDKSKLKNINLYAIIIPSRKTFFNNNLIDLNDYIKITECEEIKIKANIVENKKVSFIKQLYLLFKK